MRMSERLTSRTYDVWAWFYDRTFGALVVQRQKRAVATLVLQPGDRVLDLGVGTGMTLGYYPDDVRVIGLDLSAGMLDKAAKKTREQGLRHCALVRGDAMMPPLAEAAFDHILITHVITVVSDPQRLMRWAARLLKPGGRIVVLNHFRSQNRVIAWFERVLNPLFVFIGWRSDLALDDALRGVDLRIDRVFSLRRIDLWKIVVLSHADAPPTRPADPTRAAAHAAPPRSAPLTT